MVIATRSVVLKTGFLNPGADPSGLSRETVTCAVKGENWIPEGSPEGTIMVELPVEFVAWRRRVGAFVDQGLKIVGGALVGMLVQNNFQEYHWCGCWGRRCVTSNVKQGSLQGNRPQRYRRGMCERRRGSSNTLLLPSPDIELLKGTWRSGD